VIQSGLQQVCNEMDLSFVRSAFSPVISEALDRSDGIYAKEDGELISQGELGLPVFVGTMQFGTRCVIERAKDLHPGDVFIVNDPYLGGTHLMDVRFVKPFFYEGELFAWLANTGHWPDTGGAVPGGFSANATEVEQEGLRQFLGYADEKAILDKDRADLYQWYLNARKDRQLFRQLINSTFKEMEELFSSEIANAEKLRKKQQLFDDLRENYKSLKNEFRVLSYDNWFKKDLNNTHLLGVKRYHSKVEKFKRLFDQHGKDWREFFQAVRELAEESLKERNRRLSVLN